MTTGTLNGAELLSATLIIPRYGVWIADVEVANAAALSGAATLVLADQTFEGTIEPKGGPYSTRAWYRVVGGANGWAKVVPSKPYRSQAGVKASTVLGDAARDAGEQLAPFTDWRVGPAWTRLEDQAARVLDLLAPEAWYVDESGVTHLGVRTAGTWSTAHRLLEARPDRNWVRIAAESIAGLVPGAQLEGLEAATVRHELKSDRLQTLVFGTDSPMAGDRLIQWIVRIVRALTRGTFFHGLYEYRITGGAGGYLDVQPVKRSLGLPTAKNVPVRVGAYGARGTPATNSTALVGFINGDPSTPFVHSFAGEWAGESSVPSESDLFAQVVKLGDATATLLARADKVDSWMNEIQTKHNTHTHVIAGTVPITGAAGSTVIAATAAVTTTTIAGAGSVACAKTEGA